MPRLFRSVKLGDSLNTQILTFILPQTITNDSPKEIESKEFSCCQQKWNVMVVKNERHIGVYLCLKGAAEGLKTSVDVTFTMNNREHFTSNESYTQLGATFTHSAQRHGRKNFMSIQDLVSRRFAMDTGQYLLTLELRNVSHVFEQVSDDVWVTCVFVCLLRDFTALTWRVASSRSHPCPPPSPRPQLSSPSSSNV